MWPLRGRDGGGPAASAPPGGAEGLHSFGSFAALLLAGAAAAAVARRLTRRRWAAPTPPRRAAPARGRLVELKSLRKEEVPPRLRPEFYFDFEAHPFAHSDLLTSAHDVVEVLGAIHGYAEAWLERAWAARRGRAPDLGAAGVKLVGRCPEVCIEDGAEGGEEAVFAPDVLIGALPGSGGASGGAGQEAVARGLHVGRGAKVLGGTFDLRGGGIWLGAGATVEPGAHLAGPAIIGAGSTLRSGAYVRGDVVVGEGVYLRGEVKNAVVMDRAELCHPGYTGDSIVGHRGHFGCQALTANLGLFGGDLFVTLPDEGGPPSGALRVALGRRKVGAVLGDGSQLGCGSVTDPATFLGPRTHVYPLARLASGFYGPDEIVKNKPEACGAIVREPLRRGA